MNTTERVRALAEWGNIIQEVEWDDVIRRSHYQNNWFTEENIRKAFSGILFMLDEKRLADWVKPYELEPTKPMTIGIVMAGNLPMVGFHDLLCVLVSGHRADIKLSSQDEELIPFLLTQLREISPNLAERVSIKEKLSEMDAVIATGSDNTARYFEYYFGKYPHIIRKNRTSVAVLKGDESTEELARLGEDIFSYFGLGCRNVSKLTIPSDYEMEKLFPHLDSYQPIIDHHKYRNNYDYHKSIFLVNGVKHMDCGFLMTTETEDLVSPTSVVYCQRYKNQQELDGYLAANREKIQCTVGNGQEIAFGDTQRPAPWDYADGVDVLKFLSSL